MARVINDAEQAVRSEFGDVSFKKEMFFAFKGDPNGGWGGPPYPQKVDRDYPGAVRYVLDEQTLEHGTQATKDMEGSQESLDDV